VLLIQFNNALDAMATVTSRPATASSVSSARLTCLLSIVTAAAALPQILRMYEPSLPPPVGLV
jgi:hypothetical protein